VLAQLQDSTNTQPGAAQRLSFRLRSYESGALGLRQCVRFAVGITEEDWKSSSLPVWLAPAYVLFRPARLLRKHGLGRRASGDLAGLEAGPSRNSST
jgi:hypothetical protein